MFVAEYSCILVLVPPQKISSLEPITITILPNNPSLLKLEIIVKYEIHLISNTIQLLEAF